jgi:hypothetical protein
MQWNSVLQQSKYYDYSAMATNNDKMQAVFENRWFPVFPVIIHHVPILAAYHTVVAALHLF